MADKRVVRHLRDLGTRLPADILRELCECVLLNRVVRIPVSVSRLSSIETTCTTLALRYEIGDASFQLNVDDGFSHWSTAASRCSDDQPNAFRFVYLHAKADACSAARQADDADDDGLLGRLLGYPECCVSAYLSSLSVTSQLDPMLPLLNRSFQSGRINQFALPSPFARYLGGGFFSHFPCSMNCSRTSATAARSASAVASVFPLMATTLMELDAGFVAFGRDAGVCVWTRFLVHGSTIWMDRSSMRGEGHLPDSLSEVTHVSVESDSVRFLMGNGPTGLPSPPGLFLGYSTWRPTTAISALPTRSVSGLAETPALDGPAD
jgi:hypothetical protein